MMKDHHKGNFDLSVHFLFLNKYLDGLMQDCQGKNYGCLPPLLNM